MDEINVVYQQDMHFTAEVQGSTIELDADPENGGANQGIRPKQLMLVALAGCTAMDVASLARKMRIEIQSLNILSSAEKSKEMPVVYTNARITYNFTANDDDAPKIRRIVDMSQERYCGVAEMIRMICPLQVEVLLNGRAI